MIEHIIVYFKMHLLQNNPEKCGTGRTYRENILCLTNGLNRVRAFLESGDMMAAPRFSSEIDHSILGEGFSSEARHELRLG